MSGVRYDERSPEALEGLLADLETRYGSLRGANLSLDLTRGKPGRDQVALSIALDGILDGDYLTADGTDVRNYGGLRGIAEARELGATILGVSADQVIAAGNSSLALMHLVLETAFQYGLHGPAWRSAGAVKALCPVPGYDRHFTLTEFLGIEMVNVGMSETGPDMDEVEALVAADPSVKALWCVPKYSNPTGCIYSEDTVRRIAALGRSAGEGFLVMWDNAYAVHDFDFPPPALANVLRYAADCGTEDSIVLFGSTSKITFAGGGLAFVGGSAATLDRIEQRMSVMTVGQDKVNQLRHARFLNGRLTGHMQAHADLVRPKFEAILRIFDDSLKGLGIAAWTRPRGGYFITVETLPGLAADVVALARDIGVNLTPAGATHPYGKDPDDKTIRLAPTFAAEEDVAAAAQALALCIQLASARRFESLQPGSARGGTPRDKSPQPGSARGGAPRDKSLQPGSGGCVP